MQNLEKKRKRISPSTEWWILETLRRHFHSFEPKSDLRILRNAKYKSEDSKPKKKKKP